jgi:hypothetical protein
MCTFEKGKTSSKVAKRILENTPEYVSKAVRLYGKYIVTKDEFYLNEYFKTIKNKGKNEV